MSEINYYEILDVRPSATAEEIKAAYHRAARSVHPDAGGSAGMFRLVTDAYRTLADPQSRAAYDAGVRPGSDRSGPGTPGTEPSSSEPGWGEEVRWDAEASFEPPTDPLDMSGPPPTSSATEFVDRQSDRLDRWMVSGRGPTTMRWATVLAVAIYAAITYVLVARPGLFRPEAAGSDAWGDLLDNTSVLRIVLIAYAVLVVGAYFGLLWIPLAIVHGATFLAVVVWFVVYWGLATDAERFGFVAIVALWSVYAAVMAVVPLLREYRHPEDAQPV